VSVLVRVRVKVRVSFRLAPLSCSVWPPVSLRVRVSLGFRDRVRVRVNVRVSFRLATFMYSVWPPVPHFPYAKPQKF